jgi:hypothetical protein
LGREFGLDNQKWGDPAQDLPYWGNFGEICNHLRYFRYRGLNPDGEQSSILPNNGLASGMTSSLLLGKL